MKEKIKKAVRSLTFGEEVANAITHGVSALGVLVMMPIIYIHCYGNILTGKGTKLDVVGEAIFLICMFMMFLMSTIYHIMPHHSAHKSVMKTMDHICIYFAIAGTYTPIALSVFLPFPKWGLISTVAVLAIQWLTVIFGVIYKSLATEKMPRASLVIYLVMGWTALLFFPLLIQNANPMMFWLVLGGGVFYSVGAIFYAMKNMKYQHMIWHLFVTAGAVTHIIGVGFFLY